MFLAAVATCAVARDDFVAQLCRATLSRDKIPGVTLAVHGELT